ncbi:MAG TPA: MATE family efflux transporter [Spirochaetota bacterium]|nr:MATE family efflux transporter [Spirochaetota bacterium]
MQNQILEGHIYKIITKLSVPVVIGHMLMFFYNIADTIFISYIDRSSETLMSGLGLVFPLFFLYIALGSGIFNGISSLVARSIGAKDEKTLSRVADSGLLLSLIAAAATIIIAFLFSTPILNILAGSQISQEALGHAKDYFLYFSPGLSLMLIQMTLAGILQGEGKPQYMGISMTISTVLNIILDPVFIFVLGLGVKGAALASSISISISLLIIIMVFIRQKSGLAIHWSIFKAKFSIIIEILRIGIPHTTSMIILSFSFMALNRLVGSISEIAMSSYVIYGRINELIMLPAYGIGNAAMTLVGQNYGNKNYPRVYEIVKSCIKAGAIASFIFALVIIISAPLLFPLFSEVPEIVSFAIMQARIFGIGSIGISASIVIGSAFQGAGRAMPGFVLTFTKSIMVLVPLSYFLVQVMGYGFQEFVYAGASVHIFFAFISILWIVLFAKKLAHQKTDTELFDKHN